jgi:hypothetical protein
MGIKYTVVVDQKAGTRRRWGYQVTSPIVTPRRQGLAGRGWLVIQAFVDLL